MSRSPVRSRMSVTQCLSLGVCLLACLVHCEIHTHVGHGHQGSPDEEGEGLEFSDLESLLGDSVDMEELASLPIEVRLERLEALAKSHDRDGDGFIDMDELVVWVHQSIVDITKKEAVAFIAEIDDNKDGKVDFPEVLKHLYDNSESYFNTFNENGESLDEIIDYRMMVVEKKRVEAADLDKDGLLNSTEVVAFFDPSDFPYMYEVEAERAMVSLDVDRNRKLSLQEFVGEFGDMSPTDSQKQTFKGLDTDGDGLLTTEECVPWAVKHNSREMAEGEARSLMERSDIDKDQKLSIAEVINREEEFFGSGTTDYGHSVANEKDEL